MITVNGVDYVFELTNTKANELINDLISLSPDPEWDFYKFFSFCYKNHLYSLYDPYADKIFISDCADLLV